MAEIISALTASGHKSICVYDIRLNLLGRIESWVSLVRPLCRRCAARTGIFGWWAATGSCASCRPRNPTTSW